MLRRMWLDPDAVAAAEEKRPSGLMGSNAWTPPKRCDDGLR
jgi:hypothetical protein